MNSPPYTKRPSKEENLTENLCDLPFSFWDQPTRRLPLPFLGANLGAVGSFYLLGNIQSGKSEKKSKSLGKDPGWEKNLEHSPLLNLRNSEGGKVRKNLGTSTFFLELPGRTRPRWKGKDRSFQPPYRADLSK
jgi:hypothetical protein